MLKKIFLIAVLALLVTGPVHARKLSRLNLAPTYNEFKFTGFQAQVYHTSDSISTIYIQVQLKDLQYVKKSIDGQPVAEFKVSYELYDSWDDKNPADSASFLYSDTTGFGTDLEMIVNFDVPTSFPGNYILKISLTDLNRESDNSIFKVIEIFKETGFEAQNFFLTDDTGYPVFGRHFQTGKYFKIHFNDTGVEKFVVRYYDREMPIAKTPFATEKDFTFKFEPDSFFTISMSGGESQLLELPYRGIYHFQTDAAQTQGLTLYHFDEGFPEVSSPAQAIAPLRYLTTQKEFDELISYSDLKTAVDSFWLERASQHPERAKNMIQRYYSRVQDANLYFTSFTEGWKTDRGLIYIIYGPPSEVYRSKDEEEWIYGEKGNPLSIKFYFYKVDNPFTDNDYRLQRSPMYKTSWYIAIENWRR